MSQLVGKRITLGVTGSIAAYKAADLASQLIKYGAEVQVGKFRIEAKRRETLALPAWCRQIEAHCEPHEVPVVAYRQNGQPWRIVMKLEDFLPLMRGELTDG
jgi:hypothetical protein